MSTHLKWSIATMKGDSPLNLHPLNLQALTHANVNDVKAKFVADPFLFQKNNRYYMFIEVLNKTKRRGEIGVAESENGIDWSYKQIVLEESFHLSYPLVFEWENDIYMMPETLGAEAIRLYKAVNFPLEWEHDCDIISGKFADPTIFNHDSKWWLFACPNYQQHDELVLFYSDSPKGPWHEHSLNPLISKQPSFARPGGRVIQWGERLIRLTQDCDPYYGTRLRAFEILELSITNYKERELVESPLFEPSGEGWNKDGMHHMDALELSNGEWLACVDGFYLYEED